MHTIAGVCPCHNFLQNGVTNDSISAKLKGEARQDRLCPSNLKESRGSALRDAYAQAGHLQASDDKRCVICDITLLSERRQWRLANSV